MLTRPSGFGWLLATGIVLFLSAASAEVVGRRLPLAPRRLSCGGIVASPRLAGMPS
jgi:hypothetical protein